MKIERVEITNFQGLRTFAIALRAPVTIIAGPNYAGKSSIRDAIELAITGAPRRVSAKKDFKRLVFDGAKSGKVAVYFDGGGFAGFSLPSGEHVETILQGRDPAEFAIALDAQRFAALKVDERRTFLFGAMGVATNAEAVKARLLDMGLDAQRVGIVSPMLRAGFEAAHKDAAGAAREAKGSWRGITGEAWGEVKAPDWQPVGARWTDDDALELAGVDAEAKANRAAQEAASAELATWRAACKTYEEKAGERLKLKARADSVPVALENVDRALANLNDFRPQVEAIRSKAHGRSTWPCPECGAILCYQKEENRLQPAPPDAQPTDFEAAARLKEYEASLGVLERTLADRQRTLGGVQDAVAALGAFRMPEPPGEQPNPLLGDRLHKAAAEITERRDALMARKSAADAMAAKKREADRAHADVLAWLRIADALAPDGLPAKLLAEAIGPLNSTAAELAKVATWRAPVIGDDMTITAGGRFYSLLSESEQWRVDAIFAVAFASVMKTGIAMLDRWDVLDIPSRSQAVAMLKSAIRAGRLQSALLFGTLKAAPVLPPNSGVDAIWLPTHVTEEQKPELAEQA